MFIGLFLIVRRNAKHANGRRLAVAGNVPFPNLELDYGSGCQGAAAILLVLDLVMITFRLDDRAAKGLALKFSLQP